MSANIPSTSGIDPQLRKVLDPVKENIELIKGRRGTKIGKLLATATSAEVIIKVNEIIDRLQG